MSFRYLGVLYAFVTALAMSACSTNYRPDIELNRTVASNPEQMPYDVGLVYTERFRSYEHAFRYGIEHVFEIGAASVPMFDEISELLFRNVSKLEVFPSLSPGQDELDFVVQFDAARFHFAFKGGPARAPDVAKVVYTVKLFTSTGELAKEIRITGISAETPPLFGSAWSRARRRMKAALINARDNYATELPVAISDSPTLMP